MRPLCPRCGVLLVALYLLVGCAGQNLEGRWRGPFPFADAKVCVLNIYEDHRFDLACQDHTWLGGGRYARDADNLTLTFAALAHHGRAVSPLPELKVQFVGHGNEVELIGVNRARYGLQRHM